MGLTLHFTPLPFYVLKRMVDILLAMDCDVLAVDSNDGYTAVMSATINGHEAVVRLLLENGADLEELGFHPHKNSASTETVFRPL